MTQTLAHNWVFCYFFKFSVLVFLEIAQDDSLEHCLGQTLEKNFGSPKLGSQLGQGFCYSLKVQSLVFPDTAQDCSLGQCLTACRAETSKKNLGGNIGAEMIFSSLIMLSVHSNLFLLLASVSPIIVQINFINIWPLPVYQIQ